MRKSRSSKLLKACKNNKLLDLAEEYLKVCSEPDSEAPCDCDNDSSSKAKSNSKKAVGRFPNIAGFCRYMKVGSSELENIRTLYPMQYDALCAIFEDEALNSAVPAALIGSYLKKRLGYSDHDEASGNLNVCFEHDVMSDGE